MSKIDPKLLAYEGADLEAMSQAKKYYQWLIKIIKPYIGSSVVEVGSGSGSFSKQLLALKPEKVALIEPAKNMYSLLKDTAKEAADTQTSVTLVNAYMDKAQDKVRPLKPDTFIYINVFEHIEDDLKELKMIKNLLKKNGHVIIFVPALQGLFSEFDESIGHFRRYSKKSITDLANKAGLEVVKVRYMDIIGILPWWISFKIMKRKKLTPGLVGVYDTYGVPVIQLLESVIKAPVGKNVLLVARKK